MSAFTPIRESVATGSFSRSILDVIGIMIRLPPHLGPFDHIERPDVYCFRIPSDFAGHRCDRTADRIAWVDFSSKLFMIGKPDLFVHNPFLGIKNLSIGRCGIQVTLRHHNATICILFVIITLPGIEFPG